MVLANRPAAPGRRIPRPLPRLILASVALVALVLFARLPPWPKYWVVLGNAAHAPVFGILAVICLLVLAALTRSRSTSLVPLAFLITVAGGIGVEWLQTFVGRDASWDDVVTDALGAACALAFVLWRPGASMPSPGRLTRGLALVVMLTCAAGILYPLAEAGAAYSRRTSLLPALAQFNTPLDLYFVEPKGVSIVPERLPDNWGSPVDPISLRVNVIGGSYPGVAFTEPVRNWRSWSVLKVDVTNPDARPLYFNVRVHDVAHRVHYDDRFNRRFEIDGSTRTTISIPLQDIQQGPKSRVLDLAAIAGIIVFTDGPSATFGRQFYLTRIWLE